MLFLMIACASQDSTDTNGLVGPTDIRDNEDTQLYATWEEALKALGYDPWVEPDPKWHEGSATFVPLYDYDATKRPFYAVLWEDDNGMIQVSGEARSSNSAIVETGIMEYWACTFDGSVDPFEDPNCTEGLLQTAKYADEEDDFLYFDEEHDGLYVRSEE